jgi:hypothetical protein
MTERHSSYFECDYCGRAYKVKSYYDRHVLMCNILSKTSAQKNAEEEQHCDTPSMNDMYMILQTLAQKYNTMEKKLEKISAWANKNKKTLNVIEWLNSNAIENMIDFHEWITNVLTITEEDMEFVFKHNFSEGMNLILQRIIALYETTLPIKAFEQKDHSFYIFKGTEWTLMSNDEFELFVNKITKGLMNQLKHWQDKHINSICQDGFTEKYVENVKKITGGDLSREQQYQRVKRHLYNHLKTNLKNLIQYEYEF